MADAKLKVFRGDSTGGEMVDYNVPIEAGMVVLDAVHYIQGYYAPDLAVRWNCKAAKCGSCSAEVNGKPVLMCKTRLDDFTEGETIEVRPIKAFPTIKDLVPDVSWNYEVNKTIKPFTPTNENTDEWKVYQEDVDRVQEFRKCIECFLCQDVCHVLRNHDKKDLENTKNLFAGPRFLVRLASLEMHPMDGANRLAYIKDQANIGYCNITKCCTEVCPEDIHITDNAIIPLKERVVDEYYDPIQILWRKITGKR
jgi:succinate dehydrogenase / fumarate reductase, iron-sulfur subunit